MAKQGPIPEADPAQVHGWLEQGAVLLVDVREAREFAAECIAGALSLPLSVLEPESFPVLPGVRVVLHCAIGKRSAAAARMLRAAGREVAHMAGGLAAWKAAGFDTEVAPVAGIGELAARQAEHPGQVLARDFMAPRGLDVAALAVRAGVGAADLAALVDGARAVDSLLSLRLARVFATEPGFWMQLQVDFDLSRAARALIGDPAAPRRAS